MQSGVAVYSPLEGALSFSFQKTMQDVISYSGFQKRSEGGYAMEREKIAVEMQFQSIIIIK
jgi:hypothetical protein